MNCPKCDYEDSESEVRLHALYHHYFLIPQCSTEVAKQNNIDYDEVRKNFKELQEKVWRNNLNLRQVPYKWEDTVKSIRYALSRGYKWNDYEVYTHVKNLPDYLRHDVVVRIKKQISLDETMQNFKDFIKQEGIVI